MHASASLWTEPMKLKEAVVQAFWYVVIFTGMLSAPFVFLGAYQIIGNAVSATYFSPRR